MKTKAFGKNKPLIGVLQLLPLPGSPDWRGRIDEVISRAEQEATAMATGGVDAILVENTFDTPYDPGRMDPAGAIAMGLIIRRIMHFTHLPIGINVLKNDPETALAIAMNVGARFIRVSLLTGAAMSESGILEGKSRDLVMYRRKLQVEGIAVYADVSLQKTVPLAAAEIAGTSLSLKTLVRQTVTAGQADGIILTDAGLSPEVIQDLSSQMDVPVWYDYAMPTHQAAPYLQAADGLVISDIIKKSPVIATDARPTVDLTKVEELSEIAEIVRQNAAATSR